MAKEGPRITPSKPGRVNCLRCQKQFMSPDRFRIHICNDCKKDVERIGLLGERDSHAYGIHIPEDEDDPA